MISCQDGARDAFLLGFIINVGHDARNAVRLQIHT